MALERREPATSTLYRVTCVLAGLVAAWLPPLGLHGPIPEKFIGSRLSGALAVWCWYSARMLIGVVAASTTWPVRWWLRGPLFGALLMIPPGFIALANPACGWPCTTTNLASGAVIGFLATGVARLVTGRDHA